jgi:hypothetical protein
MRGEDLVAPLQQQHLVGGAGHRVEHASVQRDELRVVVDHLRMRGWNERRCRHRAPAGMTDAHVLEHRLHFAKRREAQNVDFIPHGRLKVVTAQFHGAAAIGGKQRRSMPRRDRRPRVQAPAGPLMLEPQEGAERTKGCCKGIPRRGFLDVDLEHRGDEQLNTGELAVSIERAADHCFDTHAAVH